MKSHTGNANPKSAYLKFIYFISIFNFDVLATVVLAALMLLHAPYPPRRMALTDTLYAVYGFKSDIVHHSNPLVFSRVLILSPTFTAYPLIG